MGKAAYGMRNWPLAIEHYTSLHSLSPNNPWSEGELIKARARLHESTTGQYDFLAMHREFKQKKCFNFDIADYFGPIEVVSIHGKGKGIVAAKDLPKGTLLMVSKAFSLSLD